MKSHEDEEVIRVLTLEIPIDNSLILTQNHISFMLDATKQQHQIPVLEECMHLAQADIRMHTRRVPPPLAEAAFTARPCWPAN